MFRNVFFQILFCLLPSSAMAASSVGNDASSSDSNVERLSKEMYRLYSTDSIDRFLKTTNDLKTAARLAGDEMMFYKAWANQATYTFTRKNRIEGLGIAKKQQDYALEHGSKYGFYTALLNMANLRHLSKMYTEAEEEYMRCIEYQKENLPEENSAVAYLGLAKVAEWRHQYRQIIDYCEKVLDEPNLLPVHEMQAKFYICFSLSQLLGEGNDTVGVRQQFNEAYAEHQQMVKKYGFTDRLSEIAPYLEAKVNGRYGELPELAEVINSRLNRLSFLSEAYALNGHWKEAYEQYREYKRVNDSLNSAEAIKQAMDYGLQLEVAQAEMEAQKSAERTQRVFVTMLGIIAAIVIAALALILYRSNRHSRHLADMNERLNEANDNLRMAYTQLEETTKHKERIESELRIAREIQMGMVPQMFPAFPDRQDIDIHASLMPAKEVGGDLYDYFLQGNRLFFCIGDVAGKGVPAALFMAVIVNLFRMVAKEGGTPDYIATRINESLADNNENGMFCTMIIGELDLQTGRLDFCNAGHNPPIMVDPAADGGFSFITMETNAPIGLLPGNEFIGEHIDDVRGMTLFYYTDGVTEAENSTQEQFGEERLLQLFSSHPCGSSRQVIDMVQAAITAHVGNAEPSDDITMLCLKVR